MTSISLHHQTSAAHDSSAPGGSFEQDPIRSDRPGDGPSFRATPTVSMVTSRDFATTSDIGEAFGRHVISTALDEAPTSLVVNVRPTAGGVRLSAVSRTAGLASTAMVSHRAFFIDRDETRTRLHQIRPDEPEATTEWAVLMDDRTRDYCHVTVFDADDRVLCTQAVVFDDQGRHKPFPFVADYVSPFPLRTATFLETLDDNGNRVCRLRLAVGPLDRAETVAVVWQAIGVIHRRQVDCPASTAPSEVVVDTRMDGNHDLGPGDWVVIAVDERERLIAQTLLSLTPLDRLGQPAAVRPAKSAPGP